MRGPSDEREQQIEAAFSFRGNVTIQLDDGAAVACFLFNRDFAPHASSGEAPFVEVFLESGERQRYRIADIRSVELTGEDHAA